MCTGDTVEAFGNLNQYLQVNVLQRRSTNLLQQLLERTNVSDTCRFPLDPGQAVEPCTTTSFCSTGAVARVGLKACKAWRAGCSVELVEAIMR